MAVLSTAQTMGVPCLPGAPSWISLLAFDPRAARDFYGPLLGWTFEEAPGTLRDYVYASVGGVRVAGIGSLPSDGRYQASWTTFFGVSDLDAAARRVRDHLGTVGVGPMDTSVGRAAIAVDPEGASFGLLEGASGQPLVPPVPGAPIRIDLATDAFAAALFYGGVLDWAEQDPAHFDVAWEHERVVLRVEGRSFASMRTADSALNEVPERPHWHVSFSVTDLVRATSDALRLGATLVRAPEATPFGETATFEDPEGAPFSLLRNGG